MKKRVGETTADRKRAKNFSLSIAIAGESLFKAIFQYGSFGRAEGANIFKLTCEADCFKVNVNTPVA